MRRMFSALRTELKWKDNLVFAVTGITLAIEALVMILTMLPYLSTDANSLYSIIFAVIVLAVSLFLIIRFGMPIKVRPATGVFTITFVGLLLVLFGMVPYLFEGFTLSNAFFESASGFTTTGLTAIYNLEELPHSILLWRSVTGWMGGFIFICLFSLLLPRFGFEGRFLISRNTIDDRGATNSKKINGIICRYAVIYVLITTVETIILTLLGNGLFNSTCLAMSTISTTGFSNYSAELTNLDYISKTVIAIFMIIGATNLLTTVTSVLKRSLKPLKEDNEFVQMILWFVCAIVILIIILAQAGIPTGTAADFADTVFAVLSIGTSTGFIFHEFSWPDGALTFLVIVAVVGGCINSAAGGLKVSRIIIIVKSIYETIRKYASPNEVYVIHYNKKDVDDSIVTSCILTVVMFTLTILIGLIVLMVLNMDSWSALTLSVSSVTTTGSGLFCIGDIEYASASVKVVLCILMWIGRLEILLALMFLSPNFWKELTLTYFSRLKKTSDGIRQEFSQLQDFPGLRR